MPPLGDRKPSALMDEMLSLLGNHESCLLFEELFLQRMPNDIRICLAKEDLEEPRQLARRADQLWQARNEETEYAVMKLKQLNSGDKSHMRMHSDDSQLCFYHWRFGKRARQCCPPCVFQGNEQPGRR
ncbi:uncharacterized protein LOC144749499 [Ciona intestinalis]